MSSLLSAQNLHYTYPDGTEALTGVDLELRAGEKLAVLGPNGAGKSTLLLHLNGLLVPQKGEIIFAGSPVSEMPEAELRRRVGIVFQDPDDQIFSPTVTEDIAFGLVNSGVSDRKEIRDRVKATLAALRIEAIADRPPHHLSYGQKKRVAIAGILVVEPDLLIFDEPLAYLDPQGRKALAGILSDLSRQGKTLIAATHNIDFAAEWADRVLIIKDGASLFSGPTIGLIDEELIEKADLVFPLVSRVFEGLLPEDGRLPLRLAEARRLLSEFTSSSDTMQH